MPGNSQLSVDLLVEKAKALHDKGIQALLLFGIPGHKDETGLVACQHNGIVQQAVRALKKEVPVCTSLPTFAIANTPGHPG